jgi:hypothetical protein
MIPAEYKLEIRSWIMKSQPLAAIINIPHGSSCEEFHDVENVEYCPASGPRAMEPRVTATCGKPAIEANRCGLV